MGSQTARVREFGPFRVTEARFPPGATLTDHWHDRVTFAVMLEGGFDLIIGGRRFECGAGTVLTEPGGDRHSNEIGADGAHVLVVQPEPDLELPSALGRVLDRVSCFSNHAILGTARSLAGEISDPDDVTPLESQALIFEMMAISTRLETERTTRGDPPRWFRRLEELIHDRFLDRLRLEELAEETGIHASHLSRVFRRRYGISIGRYLRKLRVRWAAERLVRSDDSLSRIALRAGFSDQSHFTRVFRRHRGLTPGRYRELHWE